MWCYQTVRACRVQESCLHTHTKNLIHVHKMYTHSIFRNLLWENHLENALKKHQNTKWLHITRMEFFIMHISLWNVNMCVWHVKHPLYFFLSDGTFKKRQTKFWMVLSSPLHIYSVCLLVFRINLQLFCWKHIKLFQLFRLSHLLVFVCAFEPIA